MPIRRPEHLQANVWTGQVSPDGAPGSPAWAQTRRFAGSVRRELAAAGLPDSKNWRDERVGWGLVLPDDDALSDEDRATAADAEEPIRRLRQARGDAPVFRYRRDGGANYLFRYFADGREPEKLSVQASRPGIGDKQLPKYLLIVAGPDVVPWSVQYTLNMWGYVGRLPLSGEPLRRYVDALLSDEAEADPAAAVVWRVDHGDHDITWLMARVVAGAVWDRIKADDELKDRSVCLKDGDATAGKLVDVLQDRAPGFVLTTSHGLTGPLDDGAALAAGLGLPVDAEHAPLPLDAAAAWEPGGAIWYAHACCSAGSDAASRYAGLFTPEDDLGAVLHGVAAGAGARVAPLPVALLGAEKPLRAFVGHVEPTFDWTLRDPQTDQVVAHALQTALYDRLYQADRPPIGWALEEVFDEAGAFFGAWREAKDRIDEGDAGAADEAMYQQLVAMDRQSVVVLGDPAVGLPKPGGAA